MRTTKKDFDLINMENTSMGSIINQRKGNHYYYGKQGLFGREKTHKIIQDFDIESQ
jgi:hypothetical protein